MVLCNFQFRLCLIILRCYRHPQTILLETELALGGVKLARNTEFRGFVWVFCWLGLVLFYQEGASKQVLDPVIIIQFSYLSITDVEFSEILS